MRHFIYCLFLIIATNLIQGDHVIHKRTKRFIFPSNAVIQFSMALTLPATVKGRNIGTNHGVLFHTRLPTNITQLVPPDIIYTVPAGQRFHRNFMTQIKGTMDSFGHNGEACLRQLFCSIQQEDYEGYLPYHLLHIFLNEHFGSLPKNESSRRGFACKKAHKDCNFHVMDFLFGKY